MDVCTECGFEAKNYVGLLAHQRGRHTEGAVAVMEPPAEVQPRSVRGQRRRQRDMQVLAPIDQIRGRPADITGAWAYYINPEGATIRDALILYPNGAQLSRQEDPRGKFSENAAYYQQRQARKGLEYIGPTLTESGVRRLVEVLQANKDDEILDLEDQIAECESDIANSDRPEVRDGQRRRRAQLTKRLETVRRGFDPDALIAELNQIAQAQRLARVDPNVLAVMREMTSSLDAKLADMVSRFQSTATGPDSNDAVWTGKAVIE